MESYATLFKYLKTMLCQIRAKGISYHKRNMSARACVPDLSFWELGSGTQAGRNKQIDMIVSRIALYSQEANQNLCCLLHSVV